MTEFLVRFCDSPTDREGCYRLRHIVFVDEQNVPVSMERDEYDETDALHFGGFLGDNLIATGRIVVTGDTAKVGRVAVSQPNRSRGFGYQLMESIISYCSATDGIDLITLNAQLDVVEFYERLGFAPNGSDFLEAGIMHRPMSLTLTRNN